jgi:aspartate racemase
MMSRPVKRIGIVGGVGPESTIEYYRQLIARYREQIGDGSYPPIARPETFSKMSFELRSSKKKL